MQKWFLSSTGNGDLSLTIKGVLIGIIPVVIILLGLLNVQVSSDQLVVGVEHITAIIAAAVTLAGASRKLYFWFKETFLSKK